MYFLFTFVGLIQTDFPFRNVSLPWAERVDDLVKRLTLEEMVAQMARGGGGTLGGPAPAIPRLGIKPYQWNTECLRGVALTGEATAFAQSINLGAMFRLVTIRRHISPVLSPVYTICSDEAHIESVDLMSYIDLMLFSSGLYC